MTLPPLPSDFATLQWTAGHLALLSAGPIPSPRAFGPCDVRRVADDLDVWDAYDAIAAPTLLLRGAASDVLAAPVAARMTQRGPKPRLIEFAGVGHAPTLATAAEIELLRTFLAS